MATVAIDSLELSASGSRPLDEAESLVITMFSCVEHFRAAVSKLTNPALETLRNFYQYIIRKRRKHRELLFQSQGVHSILIRRSGKVRGQSTYAWSLLHFN